MEEGENYEKQAKRKVFGLFKKYEEGADLFQRAASAFKRDSLWPDAARCYEQAADAFRHLKGREADAARMYNEAANCHRKDSLSDAERCMRLCVECQLAGGKLRNAARTFRDAGRIALEAGNLDSAIEHFLRGADTAEGEDHTCLECGEQAALLIASHRKDYAEAARMFEDLATRAIGNPLTIGLAPKHMFRAGLCLLCLKDPENVHVAMERFVSKHPPFQSTREMEFLQEAVESLAQAQPDRYAGAVVRLERVFPLDSWLTEVMLVIKRGIESARADAENPA